MGSKYFQIERAEKNNVAAKRVLAHPRYAEKFEKQLVRARERAESESESSEEEVDEVDGSKGKTLSDVLAAVKKSVQNPQLWKNIDLCLRAIEPTIALMRTADSDRLMIGEVWMKMNMVSVDS